MTMKRIGRFVLPVVLAGILLAGCVPYGFIYTDAKGPLAATSNEKAGKVGTGEAISILGLVAVGDASIESAAAKAGITKIHHVDWQTMSILWVYTKATVRVYGE
jgi:hypothetical protein